MSIGTVGVTREADMLAAVDSFLATHQAWVDDVDAEQLTVEYEEAIADVVSEFASGDVPGRCRALAAAVGTLATEYEAFQGYVTQLKWQPRNSFWAAVEGVLKARAGATARPRRTIEPVRELIRQNVPMNQIALFIYGHEPYEGATRVGPFLENGIPRHDLIRLEAEKPGSIIQEGWVHPSEQHRVSEDEARAARCLQRLAEKLQARPDAPESVEQLLNQGVYSSQIAMMKNIDIGDVYKAAEALGITPTERPDLHAMRGPMDTPLDPQVEKQLDARHVEPEPETEGGEVAAELPVAGSDSEIIEYLTSGFSVTDVVQQTGADVDRVQAVAKSLEKPAKKGRK